MFRLLRRDGWTLAARYAHARGDASSSSPRRVVGISLQSTTSWTKFDRRSFSTSKTHGQSTDTSSILPPTDVPAPTKDQARLAKRLPVVCPGCGAFSQTVEPDTPGFYSPRKLAPTQTKKMDEDRIFREAMARLAVSAGSEESSTSQASAAVPTDDAVPICDRCHGLIYQSKGHSILHPSMQSIEAIIEASPHKQNHIYHVVDAADFPMSLIPNLMSALKLPRLRTQNRRSKSIRYARDRVAEVSFIITRSDLLAPQKEQVDRLMPYLQEVLRDALGRTGKHVRLGNVRCVSAKRGWWTPAVKQEIWERGGVGWVVGKVNVGKSALFEVVFPKGRTLDTTEGAKLHAVRHASAMKTADVNVDAVDEGALDALHSGSETAVTGETAVGDLRPTRDALGSLPQPAGDDADEVDIFEEDSLLPPVQPEAMYPQMPIVSALPGTTASPIRVPFGKGKGELIDLPGVHRSSLETHIKPEWQSSLVMKSRVVPEQYTLKPGQSLLVGGLVRITPRTDDLIVLAYPFTPLDAHVTATQKAIAIQTGVNEDATPYTGTVVNIGTDTSKQRIASAGTFKLQWDVTKRRAGPLTDKTAGKQRTERLPFIVYSADILVEGVGWVELVCQVRKRRQTQAGDAFGDVFGDDLQQADPPFPEVEVFTPKGKFIGIRRPMNAWLLGGPKKVAKHARRERPRMSMSMHRRKDGGRLGAQNINLGAA